MSDNKPKQILIAPLDWGLGHTTRCVPVIRYLRLLGHSVTVAGNEWQRSFINETFPGIETIHLEGYNVSYSEAGFMRHLLLQIPRLLRTIRDEHQWLLQLMAARRFDGIISDNRYGLHHPTIPSAFMTHQLQPISSFGKITDALLRKLHYSLIRRFDDCWVVDVPGIHNLAGLLSHPSRLPEHANYMGLLSQVAESGGTEDSNHHLLVLLSGPEPQRTILADLLWKQTKHYQGKVVFVEGSASVPGRDDIPQHIEYYKRVTRERLSGLIGDAQIVICRSGYSTLMDLAALRKKAILIPTPGQTEQEYLAKHLNKERVYLSFAQQAFELENAIKMSAEFPFTIMNLDTSFRLYKKVLENWTEGL